LVVVELVAKRLSVSVVEAVILSVKRFVKYPLIPLIIFEKKFEVVALVKLALVIVAFVVFKLVMVEEEKVGVGEKAKVTTPSVVVETVRLELVEEAKKV